MALDSFDALIHHYSVRICFDTYPWRGIRRERRFTGQKILFIQDEYNNTDAAQDVINYVGYDFVFSCVNGNYLDHFYPKIDRTQTRFYHVLTGYTTEPTLDLDRLKPPDRRPIDISYRGRSLGPEYGFLGQLKSDFPRMIESHFRKSRFQLDISVRDEDRLYGLAWTRFLEDSRVVLGTPSGSNVIDRSGKLARKVQRLRQQGKSDLDIYTLHVKDLELPGSMNQISPRIFEAIAHGSALCLYHDKYSGVLEPYRHFLPIYDDYSNLAELEELLSRPKELELMRVNAFNEIIRSGLFSYSVMIDLVDDALDSQAIARPRGFSHSPSPGETIGISFLALILNRSTQFKVFTGSRISLVLRIRPRLARRSARSALWRFRQFGRTMAGRLKRKTKRILPKI